jgi:hypothetical protein
MRYLLPRPATSIAMNEFRYISEELELFAGVDNWKSYWSSQIQPFIAGDTIEVGAGIGANTRYLDQDGNGRWVCLEPDSRLIAQLADNLPQTTGPRRYETKCGTTQALKPFTGLRPPGNFACTKNDWRKNRLRRRQTHLRATASILDFFSGDQEMIIPYDGS